MARKSSIRQVVDGLPLREYLLKCLVKKTYRTLLKDNNFKIKTGIKSLGNFYNQTDKLNINIKEIYSYGIENRLIAKEVSFEEWIAATRKNFDISKITSERDILIKIGEDIGLYFDDYVSKEVIRTTLEDFIDSDSLEKQVKVMME